MNLPIDCNVIAPYWADADITNVGSGTMKYGNSNDTVLLGRIVQDVSAAFPEIASFSPIYAYTFTWYGVGYYSQNTDLVSHNNSF